MSTSTSPGSRSEGLRERHIVPAILEESPSALSSRLVTPQNEVAEEGKETKTFGRTPDGTSMSSLRQQLLHTQKKDC